MQKKKVLAVVKYPSVDLSLF